MSLPTEWTSLPGYRGVEYINGFMTGDESGTIRLRRGEKSIVIEAGTWMVASRRERHYLILYLRFAPGYMKVKKRILECQESLAELLRTESKIIRRSL